LKDGFDSTLHRPALTVMLQGCEGDLFKKGCSNTRPSHLCPAFSYAEGLATPVRVGLWSFQPNSIATKTNPMPGYGCRTGEDMSDGASVLHHKNARMQAGLVEGWV